MKNITVSVDDETYRKARIKAAERETSVSALVRKFLADLVSTESEFDRLARRELELRKQSPSFDPTDRLTRDELYERRR